MTPLLALDELEKCARLRAFLAALLFFSYLTFDAWKNVAGLFSNAREQMNFLPTWPVSQLPYLLFLSPDAHRLTLSFLAYLALAGCLSLFVTRSARPQALLLLGLALAELYFYGCNLRLVTNFHHVHLILSAFFLFSRQKLFFIRLGLGLIYWSAALVKLSPSWLSGDSFLTSPQRLPFLPEALVVPACIGLFVLEVVAPLMWMSSRASVRNLSVALLLAFHLYSGFLVGHWYTSLMIPLVAIALLPLEGPFQRDYRFAPRDLVLWLFCGLLLIGGLWSFRIPGDVRLTAEGRFLGLFMFDAHRRAEIRYTVDLEGKTYELLVIHEWLRPQTDPISVQARIGQEPFQVLEKPLRVDSKVLFQPAYFRGCNLRLVGVPYVYRHYASLLEKTFHPDQIGFQVITQLDGSSQRHTVVDIDDFSSQEFDYDPFRRNDWVLIRPDSGNGQKEVEAIRNDLEWPEGQESGP